MYIHIYTCEHIQHCEHRRTQKGTASVLRIKRNQKRFHDFPSSYFPYILLYRLLLRVLRYIVSCVRYIHVYKLYIYVYRYIRMRVGRGQTISVEQASNCIANNQDVIVSSSRCISLHLLPRYATFRNQLSSPLAAPKFLRIIDSVLKLVFIKQLSTQKHNNLNEIFWIKFDDEFVDLEVFGPFPYFFVPVIARSFSPTRARDFCLFFVNRSSIPLLLSRTSTAYLHILCLRERERNRNFFCSSRGMASYAYK